MHIFVFSPWLAIKWNIISKFKSIFRFAFDYIINEHFIISMLVRIINVHGNEIFLLLTKIENANVLRSNETAYGACQKNGREIPVTVFQRFQVGLENGKLMTWLTR